MPTSEYPPGDGGTEPPSARSDLDAWMPEIYACLHDLAARAMRDERAEHTLQPTAIVNEVYLRMANATPGCLDDKSRFLGAAAATVRRVLVDHARARNRDKRGGGQVRVELPDIASPPSPSGIDLAALDEAIAALAVKNPRAARVVELRFFGGLSFREMARYLKTSARAVHGDWIYARAWLSRELQ